MGCLPASGMRVLLMPDGQQLGSHGPGFRQVGSVALGPLGGSFGRRPSLRGGATAKKVLDLVRC
eukprot:12399957-Alexandrium_andersonii.AAC.1